MKNVTPDRRSAVFAHYDQDGIIDEYVLYFLRALRPLCGRLVFVSDCDLVPGEADKLGPLADAVIAGRHGEYDFGSYKRGFAYARENGWLDSSDELLFTNDSCYGPLFPLEDVFEHMAPTTTDAWSMTYRLYGLGGQVVDPHMQSYFMVMRPSLFRAAGFAEWIEAVVAVPHKDDVVITYEVGFSRWLTGAGYTYSYYADDRAEMPARYQVYWTSSLGFSIGPLLKIRWFQNTLMEKFIKNVGKYTDYPVPLIRKHRGRIKASLTGISEIPTTFSQHFKQFRRFLIRWHHREGRIMLFGKWHYYGSSNITTERRLDRMDRLQNKNFAEMKRAARASTSRQ